MNEHSTSETEEMHPFWHDKQKIQHNRIPASNVEEKATSISTGHRENVTHKQANTISIVALIAVIFIAGTLFLARTSAERHVVVFMIRTKYGLKLLDWAAKISPRLWRFGMNSIRLREPGSLTW